MKKLIIAISIIFFSINASAQNWSGSTPGNIYYNQGNVGIGTNNPIAPFHVLGPSFPQARVNSQTPNVESGIRFRSFNGGYDLHVDLVSEYIGTSDEQGKFHIRIPYNGPERLTIDHNGNVGIGITSPSRKFHVSGPWKNQIQFQQSSGTTNFAQLASGTAWVGLFTGGTAERTMMRAYHDDSKVIFENGNVGIGTDNPQSKLAVNGQIRATEVKVLADISVPDYVFESDYELRTLKETKEYITENKHLPEIPSAKEIGENGIDLGDMNMRLLKKIEELTLYQIELLERLEKAEEKIQQLENK